MRVVAAVEAELGDLDGVAIGIGPVRAAMGAARLFAVDPPGAVVLVGSAGAYAGGPPVGAAVVARRLGLSVGLAEVGLGYVPAAPEPLQTDPDLRALGGVEEVDVLTVGAITTDPALTARLGSTWQVEHMEAYAVALAAAQAGIPCAVVLGIANRVGPDAHAEWLAHRGQAEEAARGVVRRLLDGWRR